MLSSSAFSPSMHSKSSDIAGPGNAFGHQHLCYKHSESHAVANHDQKEDGAVVLEIQCLRLSLLNLRAA
ncbi:hypothetical protein MTO96_042984 [Rhipicephalus appendiculatus]